MKQEAINNRKRSSRIATRELEKEEIVRRERAQREMEERMDISRREETRQAREEAEALARDKAREDRLKEREERANAREEAAMQRLLAEQEAKEQADHDREARKRKRDAGLWVSDDDGTPVSGTGAITPNVVGVPSAATSIGTGERWELNCEVCGKRGWNIVSNTRTVNMERKWADVDGNVG